MAYGSFYLCRANVDAAMPSLLREGYSKPDLGLLSSVATLAYAVGDATLAWPANGDATGLLGAARMPCGIGDGIGDGIGCDGGRLSRTGAVTVRAVITHASHVASA